MNHHIFATFALIFCGPLATIGFAQQSEFVQFGRPATKLRDSKELPPLAEKISVDFDQTPLSDILDVLRKRTKYEFDRRALTELKITPKLKTSLVLKNIPLRSVLNHLLRPLELAWIHKDGLITITTPEEAEHEFDKLKTRTYGCRELIYDSKSKSVDGDRLVDLIISTIYINSWDDVGGPAAIETFGDSIVVQQNDFAHQAISDLLKALRSLVKKYDADPQIIISDIAYNNDYQDEFRRQLSEERIELEFIDAKLSDIVKYLSDQTKFNFRLNEKDLNDVGVDKDTRVTFQCKETSVESALSRLLKTLDLTYYLRDNVVMIWTPDSGCDWADTVKVYPVRDIVDIDEAGRANYSELTDLLRRVIAPQSWNDVGGPGEINVFERGFALVIAQEKSTHTKIDELLQNLREQRSKLSPADRKDFAEAARRPILKIYRYYTGDARTATELTKVLLENVDGLNEKEATVNAFADRVVVKANRRTQKEVALLLQRLALEKPFESPGDGKGFNSNSPGGSE
ncbi:MAG: hypothetical protein ACI9G1_004675 [Pirellulaceae bacterium]|jgi:hypothetical protein